MSDVTEERVQEMADVSTRAMQAVSLITMMLTPEDAALLRETADMYEEQTRGKRVLAEMFGRSAINQQDANVTAKLPLLRKVAELVELMATLSEREKMHVHGEEFWTD